MNDENFEWFTSLPPKHSIYYTPPSMDATFPDNVNNNIGIIFALATPLNGIYFFTYFLYQIYFKFNYFFFFYILLYRYVE